MLQPKRAVWSGRSGARYACLFAGVIASLSACSSSGTQASGHDGGGAGGATGGTGGGAGGTAGGSAGGSGQGGADASASADIHYGICDATNTTIFRIDRTAATCTFVVLAPPPCPSGTMISNWCFSTAGFSTDVASCDALQIPANAVAATGAAGTFTTRVTDPAGPGGVAIEVADFDLTLTFPADAGVPASDHFAGSDCLVACLAPTAACGT